MFGHFFGNEEGPLAIRRMSSRTSLVATTGFIVLSLSACHAISGDDGFSDEEWKEIKRIEPLSTPRPDSLFNRMADDEELARFGQALFFETDLAEPSRTDGPRAKIGEAGKFGCVTCHDTKYFTDSSMVISQGGDRYEQHNSPTLTNVAYWDWYLWMGLFDSLFMHGNYGTGQEASPLGYAHYIYKKYKVEYERLFEPLPAALADDSPEKDRFPPVGSPGPGIPGVPPTPYDTMTDADKVTIDKIRANVARAFEAYPRRLITRNSPFENYIHGDEQALSPEQKRGLRLFIGKAACTDCHNGPLLSDQKFHNIGIPTPFGQMPDTGRAGILFLQFIPPDLGPGTWNAFSGAGPYSDNPALGKDRLDALQARDCVQPVDPVKGCVARDELVGAFRTPTLLNIAETAPYFHTGGAKTLEEVVRHYNQGGGAPGTFAGTKSARLRPLGLTNEEISDLVAFLTSLTGEFAEPSFAGPPENPKPPLPPAMMPPSVNP